MPLTAAQNQKLTFELIRHCDRIKSETDYDPRDLRVLLASVGAEQSLLRISSRETSGLARLYELGHPNLSVERYILDSHWAQLVGTHIVALCRANLRD